MSKSRPKKILFVCVENARRSQMAEAFARALGKERVEVYSAGSGPASQIDPRVIEVMKEKGIELAGKQPQGLNDLPLAEMDYLVTMGCEDACPAVPAKKIIEWTIPDPKGKPVNFFREVRDIIEAQVRGLLAEIVTD